MDCNNLANALRALLPLVPFDGNHDDETRKGPQLKAAREALAAFDRQQQALSYMETANVLVVTTGHVTKAERDEIEREGTTGCIPGHGLIISLTGAHGWMLRVASIDDDDQGKREVMSAGLRGVYDYARAAGFTHVWFDCDAQPLPGVTTYEW